MKNKPFAVVKRECLGPRHGRVVLGWDVVDVRANISLKRLPSAKLARRLRDELNRGSTTGYDILRQM